MHGRSVCVCVCVEKCPDGGESIKRWKRDFGASCSKTRPSYSWLETSPLTSTWYIIIPVLWSRCNCLLLQAVMSKWWSKRNYPRPRKHIDLSLKAKKLTKILFNLCSFSAISIFLHIENMPRACLSFVQYFSCSEIATHALRCGTELHNPQGIKIETLYSEICAHTFIKIIWIFIWILIRCCGWYPYYCLSSCRVKWISHLFLQPLITIKVSDGFISPT